MKKDLVLKINKKLEGGRRMKKILVFVILVGSMNVFAANVSANVNPLIGQIYSAQKVTKVATIDGKLYGYVGLTKYELQRVANGYKVLAVSKVSE